jgi:hypothetical protein
MFSVLRKKAALSINSRTEDHIQDAWAQPAQQRRQVLLPVGQRPAATAAAHWQVRRQLGNY